ncbi:MAG TPA: plasmid maintenance system killer [bacterium]|nr:plasmid maintenance system killer [bacterium]
MVMRKLDMLNYAARLSDLRSPPGNSLESLGSDLTGFQSIRINDQWGIVFCWTDAGPSDVRITDYH